ncbi:hypothetical protein [Olleya sp. Hel_I_94]|uniref:hypothetical protein n=1 Tax=Olleya sp. Hel_I_94 TaxID=1250001 RepID=UPI0011AB1880|nr:hypothetical protein [Olleya sp. Hel_I_94]
MKTNTTNNDKRIFYFLKFGNKENMTDLLENGTIYFNTIDYFQKLEEQIARGDNYEGTTNIKNYHEYDKLKVTLTIPETGKEIELNPKKFHLREFLTEIKGNLYSMYSIKSPDVIDSDYKIDQRVKEFGTHFVIIKNVVKFLDLICEEIEKQNISYRAKIVSYYEKEKINGEITLFDKSTEYEYQKEFRIVLYTNEINPIALKIGNLSEIAEIFEIKAIDDMKLEWTNKNGVEQRV